MLWWHFRGEPIFKTVTRTSSTWISQPELLQPVFHSWCKEEIFPVLFSHICWQGISIAYNKPTTKNKNIKYICISPPRYSMRSRTGKSSFVSPFKNNYSPPSVLPAPNFHSSSIQLKENQKANQSAFWLGISYNMLHKHFEVFTHTPQKNPPLSNSGGDPKQKCIIDFSQSCVGNNL